MIASIVLPQKIFAVCELWIVWLPMLVFGTTFFFYLASFRPNSLRHHNNASLLGVGALVNSSGANYCVSTEDEKGKRKKKADENDLISSSMSAEPETSKRQYEHLWHYGRLRMSRLQKSTLSQMAMVFVLIASKERRASPSKAHLFPYTIAHRHSRHIIINGNATGETKQTSRMACDALTSDAHTLRCFRWRPSSHLVDMLSQHCLQSKEQHSSQNRTRYHWAIQMGDWARKKGRKEITASTFTNDKHKYCERYINWFVCLFIDAIHNSHILPVEIYTF